jgi:iron complex transport system permease protein
VPLPTVVGVLANKLVPGLVEPTWIAGREAIVWDIRFPRALLAALVGAALGLVGAALQAVTRNPLADPHLLGISSGAAFGAILALLHTGMFLGSITVPLLAFCAALVAATMVVGVAGLAGATSADRLVLAGVTVSFIVLAGANVLIFLGDPRATHTVVFWMLGGLGLAQWAHLIWPLVVLVPAGAWLWLRAPEMNAMGVGALITGVMVAFSDIIGFVGLMMLHVVRLVLGGNNARVLRFSALFGAILLIWADIIARVVMAPEDMSIGVVIGLIGGLFFVMLLGKRRSQGTAGLICRML